MNILARVINFSLMIAMPFGLAVYLVRKHKTDWYLFGIGVIAFILSQIFHIPFNQWVLNPLVAKLDLSLAQHGIQLAVIGLLYGLSAGLFEEAARFLGYSVWIKKERSWESALMFGAGHGGIESIILGAIVLLGFVQAITLRDVDLSTIVDPDQVQLARAQIEAYWAAPWHLAILGAVERLASIVFHLSAAVLVLQSFRRKNIIWVILAVSWHTLVDAVAVFASQTWNPYVTEGIIFGMGFLSLGLIFALRSRNPSSDQRSNPDAQTPAAKEVTIQSIKPSKDNLEDSRYI